MEIKTITIAYRNFVPQITLPTRSENSMALIIIIIIIICSSYIVLFLAEASSNRFTLIDNILIKIDKIILDVNIYQVICFQISLIIDLQSSCYMIQRVKFPVHTKKET